MHKAVVIKKSINAYISATQNKKYTLVYQGTEKECYLVIINNIQKLKQLTKTNNSIDFNSQYAVA